MIPKGYALIEFEMKLNRCAVSKKQIFFIFFLNYIIILNYKNLIIIILLLNYIKSIFFTKVINFEILIRNMIKKIWESLN